MAQRQNVGGGVDLVVNSSCFGQPEFDILSTRLRLEQLGLLPPSALHFGDPILTLPGSHHFPQEVYGTKGTCPPRSSDTAPL